MFLTLFASVLAVSLSIHMTEHRRFHRWLRHPHRPHALQHKAGLGAGPCPAFGLLATGGHDVFMGPILLVCLLATAAGVPFASLAACAASLSFLSDTFCETTAGSHAPLLIPPILLYGALSPSASLLLHMVRWHVASAYMGAVLSKAALALYFNRSWVSGETLQLYLFEARFKARCGAARRMLQRFLLRRPRLLAALSVGSLAVELCIGLSPCFPRPWPVMVAGAACGLHVGIHLVMGVDFLSYWCPALLAFALPCEAPTLLDAATDALAAAPACTASALLLLAVQLFHVATLHDIRSGVDDRLPFSCFPLYALPRSLADGWGMIFVLSSANLAAAGNLDPFYHHPASIFTFGLDDMRTLPDRRVVFGCAPVSGPLVAFIRPELRGVEFGYYDNAHDGHTGCESSAALRHACETLVRTIRATQPAASIERLLHLQDEVLRAFECAAESPRDPTVAR